LLKRPGHRKYGRRHLFEASAEHPTHVFTVLGDALSMSAPVLASGADGDLLQKFTFAKRVVEIHAVMASFAERDEILLDGKPAASVRHDVMNIELHVQGIVRGSATDAASALVSGKHELAQRPFSKACGCLRW
jgi:hypothetical protein